MPEIIPIYKDRDLYVPAFEVKIGGNDLPKEILRDILDVQYTDTLGEFDRFDITVNNWDEEKLDFKYTGSKNGIKNQERDERFDPGQEIELWMGYFSPPRMALEPGSEPKTMHLMLAGIITTLSPIFPAGGQPTLKISGRSVLMKLITRQEVHTYPSESGNSDARLRDSDIARMVGQRGNLSIGDMAIEVRINEQARDQEPAHPEPVVQNNQYDILFLLQLAHQNGYDLVLKQSEQNGETTQALYFGPSTQEPPFIYLLEWGKSLIQFQPTLTTANQVNQLTVRGWDAQRRQPINVPVSRDDLPTRSLRDTDRLHRIEQAFQHNEEIIVDRPFRDEHEARQFALARLEGLSKDMVTARGATVGTPNLRVGRKIEIQGLGLTFDGQYFITATTHSIGSSGYTTEFDARLEEKN